MFQEVRFSQVQRVFYPSVACCIVWGKAFNRVAVNTPICQFDSAVAHIPHQTDLNGKHRQFVISADS